MRRNRACYTGAGILPLTIGLAPAKTVNPVVQRSHETASGTEKQMRYCYANRRFTLYPQSVDSWDLSPENYTDDFLKRVRDTGFDALEIGTEVIDKIGSGNGNEAGVREFATRLDGFGLKVGALRSGGTLTDAKNGATNRARLGRAVKYAGWLGAEIVNGALGSPTRYPGHPPGSIPASQHGWPVAQDSSKEAMMNVYDEMAGLYQRECDVAADTGVTLSVEVHQNSPVDNSWSAKLLTEKVDRKNFGINPDVGNVLWTYDVPEEESDHFMRECAPVAVYWHCKNLHRIYHPENQRSVFIRVPLPDGEIDYRFAISAMADAGYSGYMAIEGAWSGDQWASDQRSLDYAKGIWAELETGKTAAAGNSVGAATA